MSYYLAIDLGTTNTAIAFGQINAITRRFETRVMDLNVLQSNGDWSEKKVVPSCVYIDNDNSVIVGDYAKNMAERLPEQVVCSVKSSMGRGRRYRILDKEYSALDISSFIIKFVLKEATRFLGRKPDDVIITVPASFDGEMRRETLEAATLAGIRTKNRDGSDRNILLDEPRAALYNFINGLDSGKFPNVVLDLEKPKNILVYDLGGGTLDVSLHNVWREAGGEIGFKDYAISKHTLVGGDNFDELVANYLYSKIEDQVRGASEQERSIGMQKLKSIAEKAKKKIVSEHERYKIINADEANQKIKVDICNSNIINGVPIDLQISEMEYEHIVESLLGRNYTLDSVEQIEEIRDVDNIIYPILDVLDKAYKNQNGKVQVDAVLLNGGMTRLPLIKKRIKEFFGIEPLDVQNPDLSVALGASYYHRALSMGKYIPSILNDSIGIEIKGGFVKILARAGVVLPFVSEVYDEFTVRDGTTCIDIPFYKGSRKDTCFPNKKIASRQLRLDKALNENDKICIQVEINESGIATTKAWFNNEINNKYIMEVKYLEEESEKKDSPTEKIMGRKEEVVKWQDTSDKVINKGIVNELVHQCQLFAESKRPDQRNIHMAQISNLEKVIHTGTNKNQMIGWLMERLNREENAFISGRLILNIGNFMLLTGLNLAFWTYAVEQITKIRDNPRILVVRKELYIFLVQAVGKSGDKRVEDKLREMLTIELDAIGKCRGIDAESIKGVIEATVIALSKVACTRKTFDEISRSIYKSIETTQIAILYTLGKIGARDNQEVINITQVQYVIPMIIDLIDRSSHQNIISNGVYALMAIGDRRKKRDCIDQDYAEQILQTIHKVRDKKIECKGLNLDELLNLAEKLVKGESLSDEQERNLLEIRSKLEGSISQ